MTLNLGMVRPGSTILIPFHAFDSNDPSASVIISAFVLADIGIYKGTSMDERASTTGVVLLDTDGINIDAATGIHGFSIDLSSNATAGFYSSGSHYYVTVGPITIDAATINFVAATFSIGYPDAIINTTIASVTSQTQFILTDGPAEADVLIGCPILFHDVASAVQLSIGYITDYIVTTKEVFIAADPGGFTFVATDNVSIFMPANVRAVGGTLQTAGDLAALTTAAIADTEDIQSRLPAALSNGMMDGNVERWLDTAVTAGTAGIPNVDIKRINNTATAADLLARWLSSAGRVGTSDSGSTTTMVDAARTEADDFWNGALLVFSSGTNVSRAALVTGFDAASDTLTFVPALADAVTTEQYALIPGLGWADVQAWLGTAVTTVAGGRPDVNVSAINANTAVPSILANWLNQGINATADSGTTTTLTDSALNEADDKWNGALLVFRAGTNAGYSAAVTDFDAASDTITFAPAVPNAVTTETYVLVPGLGHMAPIADAVWDEILTGSSHNIATSAGKRLRQIEETFVQADGTVAAISGHTVTLDGGAVATADYYIGSRLEITEGTGAGQSRLIVGYSASKVCTLDSEYTTNPDTNSLYEVVAADVHVSVSDSDLVEGFVDTFTNSTTITLDSVAVATTDFYKGELIIFTHGAGAGQAREITGYTSGRVVTMSPALVADVDNTTVYHIQAVVAIPEIVDEILAGGDIDGFTLEEAQKLLLAGLSKISGAATATNTFRAADDSKDRITATVDSNGNRSAVTFDASG